MEIEILNFIAKLQGPFLDKIMIFFSTIGNSGAIWILLSIYFYFRKDTREMGFTMLIGLLLMIVVGNGIIKNLIARNRPFISTNINIIVNPPSGYSFPSGHTYSSFVSAFIIRKYNRKIGISALILASLISFSRLYLYVHYPTDILAGIILGYLTSKLSFLIAKKAKEKGLVN